jgi:hypothetical protein
MNGDLPSLSKLVYMRHRRLLPHKYMYHQWRSRVGGTIENGEAPKYRDDKFVFKIIKNINVVFSKHVKGIKRKKSEKPSKDSPFKKQSIFFSYLPYWEEFEIGDVIDTMHVEKGIFESTIGLLLDIPSKTNGRLSARKDLQPLEIREELHSQENRTERLTFLQLATPSQLRRKGQYASDLSSNGLCVVIGAHCYCDWGPLSAT